MYGVSPGETVSYFDMTPLLVPLFVELSTNYESNWLQCLFRIRSNLGLAIKLQSSDT